MEEDKAAAYYDELRRKGGGAAKLKQGLGYGAPESSSPSTYRAFPSFVKGDNHFESLAKQEKESRLAVVRDKLKKHTVDNDDGDFHYDRHNSRSQEQTLNRGHGYLEKGRHHSRSQGRERTMRNGTRRSYESRSSRSSSRERGLRSRSSSRDKGNRHSCERSTDTKEKRPGESFSRVRRTSRSPRRSHSSFPRPRCSDNSHHSHRYSSKSLHSSDRSRSPNVEKHRRRETRKEDTNDARKPTACDYSKSIAGYDNMTPVEKFKEKMKLQLAETDGTGTKDDTGFLQDTGTFLSTCGQAKREAQSQGAHDAAIFGPYIGSNRRASHDSSTKETTTDDDPVVQSEAAPPINSLQSDQVSTFQQGSGREWALFKA